jgi:hypothetical protein
MPASRKLGGLDARVVADSADYPEQEKHEAQGNDAVSGGILQHVNSKSSNRQQREQS